MENIPNEETPVTPAQVEQQLSALSQRLMEQLEQHAQQENARTEALDAREQDLCRRELAARARLLLKEKELPEELASCLAFPDEEAVEKGIEALEGAFRSAVQQAVEQRLSAGAPKTGAMTPLDQLSDEEYYAAVCRND